MISDKVLLKTANVKGTGLNSRDEFALNSFGGKIFTEDRFCQGLETFIKSSPGYGSRGGKAGYEKRVARHLFNWWKDRGAIHILK